MPNENKQKEKLTDIGNKEYLDDSMFAKGDTHGKPRKRNRKLREKDFEKKKPGKKISPVGCVIWIVILIIFVTFGWPYVLRLFTLFLELMIELMKLGLK